MGGGTASPAEVMNHDGLTQEEVAALKREIMSATHCALLGFVKSYDSENQTADIQPARQGLPLLRDVPVFMPVPFEVNAGDRCLVVFADCSTDDPSGRMHSLSDGFAFIGWRSCPNL